MISDNIFYVGVHDADIDLFESQYAVPKGISYNSYVIKDDKIAVFDTVDKRKGGLWLENLSRVLGTSKPDYLIVSHMEPDHSGTIARLCALYPDMLIVGNKRTLPMLNNFAQADLTPRFLAVDETSELCLGAHTLRFVLAPMVHWPEVMMTYDAVSGTLFSADAFGTFAGVDDMSGWDDEAARYYFNIVGKYGVQVISVLAKSKALDIKRICPLHGPMLTGDALSHAVNLYTTWASYAPEYADRTTIACASIHGNTFAAAQLLKDALGESADLFDLTRDDMSEAISHAFRNGNLVLAASTYNGEVFSPMSDFLTRLKGKAYQSRRVALIENGSWAPQSGAIMHAALDQFKNLTFVGDTLTLRSTMSADNRAQIAALATLLKQ